MLVEISRQSVQEGRGEAIAGTHGFTTGIAGLAFGKARGFRWGRS